MAIWYKQATSMENSTLPSTNLVIEYYKLGHQQLLATMQKRDRMLFLNLIAQAMLLALSIGISIGPTQLSTARPDVSLFAIPIAVVFALLYVVEDGAVTSLSKYLSTLCFLEGYPNLSFEASSSLRDFMPSISLRILAQMGAFFLIPYFLVFHVYTGNVPYVFIQSILLAFILLVIGYACYRKYSSVLEQTRLSRRL